MDIVVGRVHHIARYPVKSMAGVAAESAMLGLHGLHGDRRFAFRRFGDASGNPWLSASRLPEILLYQPLGFDESADEPVPTHVRTPEGEALELESDRLRDEVAGKFGSGLELMRLKHGIFDDAVVSLIAVATVTAICEDARQPVDVRRFRPNLVIATDGAEPFPEDRWVGGRLTFGDDGDGPCVSVTAHDVRCMMINLDPDTAEQHPAVMKSVVRMNENRAGACGAVTRPGRVYAGQAVRFTR